MSASGSMICWHHGTPSPSGPRVRRHAVLGGNGGVYRTSLGGFTFAVKVRLRCIYSFYFKRSVLQIAPCRSPTGYQPGGPQGCQGDRSRGSGGAQKGGGIISVKIDLWENACPEFTYIVSQPHLMKRHPHSYRTRFSLGCASMCTYLASDMLIFLFLNILLIFFCVEIKNN